MKAHHFTSIIACFIIFHMKNKILLILLITPFLLAGCGNNIDSNPKSSEESSEQHEKEQSNDSGEEEHPQDEKLKGSLSFSIATIDIKAGDSEVVTATFNPSSDNKADVSKLTYKWELVDSSIASILFNNNSCTVTGIKSGQTSLKVSFGEISNSINVSVSEKAPVCKDFIFHYKSNMLYFKPPFKYQSYLWKIMVPHFRNYE